MTIDELISELQRIKDTYGDMEVRVIANNPIDYSKERDEPGTPLIFSTPVTLYKDNLVVTDRAPEWANPFANENTRYLSLGDFSIHDSDMRCVYEKYHARRCGQCNMLRRALSRAEKKDGEPCSFCKLRGPLSQVPYYSEPKYYCYECHYTQPPTNWKKQTSTQPIKP